RRRVNSDVMPHRFAYLSVILLGAVLSGCSHTLVVDSQRARVFGDSFVDDLIHDRRDAVYSKMEPEFHNLTSRQQFVGGLDSFYEQVGKPIKAEQASYGP